MNKLNKRWREKLLLVVLFCWFLVCPPFTWVTAVSLFNVCLPLCVSACCSWSLKNWSLKPGKMPLQEWKMAISRSAIWLVLLLSIAKLKTPTKAIDPYILFLETTFRHWEKRKSSLLSQAQKAKNARFFGFHWRNPRTSKQVICRAQ